MRELAMGDIQEISLEILKTVADICDEQKFRYFLAFGTLIGAIRHQGYIPWDDDVDIVMPRPDYDRLLRYLSAHISEYKILKVFNRETCKNYPYMITRISDVRYEIDMKNEKPYGMGVFIDIYPLDGLGNDRNEANKLSCRGDRLSSLCFQASRKHYAIETTKSRLRKLLKLPIFCFSKLIGTKFFQDKLEKLAKVKEYDQSEYVGCVIWNSGGVKSVYLRKWFDEYLILPFGKYKFRVPKDYDAFLQQLYGDYMILPPEKERIGNHFYKMYEK